MTARRNEAKPSELQPVVILLEGGQTPGEGWVEDEVGWAEHRRAAPRDYQEPVYLRSVAELLQRGPWWWVFVPLAHDCDVAGIEQARGETRGRRAELLRIAERVMGEEARQQLESIDDLDTLEREVVARLRPANDD